MPKPDPKFYIWIDLETTGLDHAQDPPLEVATMVTTPDLEELQPPVRFHSLIRLTKWGEERLVGNDYVREMHTKNDLLKDLNGSAGMDMLDVEYALCAQLDTLGEGPFFLAGTGVAAFDIQVLANWMPLFHQRLDYRTFDIGHMRRFLKYTVGMPEAWMPKEADESLHRARGDVLNALDQARGMRDMFVNFKRQAAQALSDLDAYQEEARDSDD